MPKTPSPKLIIGIASTALFDLTESHQVYQEEGVEAYAHYQIAHESDPLQPGHAFELVKKCLRLNTMANTETPQTSPKVEVILISRNSADTGLRIFNSIEHHDLAITRAAFTGGQSPYTYLRAFGAHLFLSSHHQDVQDALAAGCAAATVIASQSNDDHPDQLRFAFDGDAVIFDDSAEMIYQTQGLDAFAANEKRTADTPLPGGPFKGFLDALHHIQQGFPSHMMPIRTALVTARSAPAHARVVKTLRAWNIRIDEALFLGGMSKGDFLAAFGADVFFDDQSVHCESSRQHVTTGHVPHGITNQTVA